MLDNKSNDRSTSLFSEVSNDSDYRICPMGITKVYHGSAYKILHPKFPFINANNDYGYGFYCTPDKGLAAEWAANKASKMRQNYAYINAYTLDMSDLKILNLFDYNILYWITILLEHRTLRSGFLTTVSEAMDYLTGKFHISLEDYDIIYGYRADDSYFTFAESFLTGVIGLETLKKAMMLGHLGCQIVLVSETALNHIVTSSPVSISVQAHLADYTKRDIKARSNYRKLSSLYDTRLADIIRNDWSDSDERLSY